MGDPEPREKQVSGWEPEVVARRMEALLERVQRLERNSPDYKAPVTFVGPFTPENDFGFEKDTRKIRVEHNKSKGLCVLTLVVDQTCLTEFFSRGEILDLSVALVSVAKEMKP
jgi:hypothetical protein